MKIVLFVLIIAIALLIDLYAYYGGFKSLVISITKQGGETFIYEDVIGDYRKTGEAQGKVYYSMIEKYEIETYKGCGIFYDNPKNVEKEKLRSKGGCILEEKDMEKLSVLEKEYKIKQLPEKEYIVSEFPYKGKLSVIVSVMRVYPALAKFAKLKGYNEDGLVIEICDVPNKKLLYRKEMVKKE